MSRKTIKQKRIRKATTLMIWIIAITILILGILYMRSLFTADDIKLATEIVRTVATIITLIIAIVLFDRFGMKKVVVERQINVVIDLIEYLRKTSFIVESETMNYVVWLSTDMNKYKENPCYEADKKKQIVFKYGKNILIPNEIEDAIDNLWIPSKISESLNFLDFRIASVTESVDKKKFLIVKFGGENQNAYFRKEEQTFEKFLNNISLLMKSLKKWVETHTDVNELELNLRPTAKK